MINAEPEHQDPSSSPADPASAGGARALGAQVVQVRSLVGISLWAVLLVLAFRFFFAVQFIVLCGIGAAVLAAALQPITNHLRGPMALRAILAIVMVVLVAAGLIGLSGWLMYEPIQHHLEQWPKIQNSVNESLQTVIRRLGIARDITFYEVVEIVGSVLTGGSVPSLISNVVGSVLKTGLAVLVVIVGAMFLLARPPGSLSGPAAKLFPPSRQKPTLQAIEDIQPQYRWWLIGTLFSMVLIGVLFGLGYWIIGLQFALPLALFAGLAEVVPTFGPMLTLALSMLIAATQGPAQVIGVGIIYAVVQTVESQFLTPLVMQKAVSIPPIVTLFTIVLWGNVFGAAGLILAIPIDLTIWTFLRHHLIRNHERQAQRGEP